MRSLQRRAIVGGLVWALVVLFTGTFALFSVFDGMAAQRFQEALRDRHLQVVAALSNTNSPNEIGPFLTDPAYSRPYSGRYWQVEGPGGFFASRSLFDTTLTMPLGTADEPLLWQGGGPIGPVRGVSQRIMLADGSEWVVSVAETLAAFETDRQEMRKNVGFSFGFVGLFVILGAVALVSNVVQPIRQLRRDVTERWVAGEAIEPDKYPSEVAPLVADVNELLRKNREIVARGRRQVADLAHALKTPSAALRNELITLSRSVNASDALHALDRIDAQIVRSLARLTAINAAQTAHARTDVANSLRRLERLFKAAPEGDGVDLSVSTCTESYISVEQQDFEEMLGNVMENAIKWCRSRVVISVSDEGSEVRVRVEDDGPGIEPQLRLEALKPGGRLDLAKPGTGLGLSITQELADAYGGAVTLGSSEALGGLAVDLVLPGRRSSTPTKSKRQQSAV